jgi:radical SAM superfamily enzyme YgiQ (UPF0313 family)
VPVVIGGIEASLRRIAHYDYWSEKVRRSMLVESKADMLLFGNAERPLVELTQRMAAGEKIGDMQDILGTAILVKQPLPGWRGKDSTDLDSPGHIDPIMSPYTDTTASNDGNGCEANANAGGKDGVGQVNPAEAVQSLAIKPMSAFEPIKGKPWHMTYAKLPQF